MQRLQEPEQTTVEGPWGGPIYAYRGAGIWCAKSGHVRALLIESHPLHGRGFGIVGAVTGLVDL